MTLYNLYFIILFKSGEKKKKLFFEVLTFLGSREAAILPATQPPPTTHKHSLSHTLPPSHPACLQLPSSTVCAQVVLFLCL